MRKLTILITLLATNLVTYMRLKNIVPPTSEPGVLPQSPKK